MFRDPPSDFLGAKQSLAVKSSGLEQALEQGSEVATQPASNRDAESSLGAAQDRRGELTRDRALEQPFGDVPAVLEPGGQLLHRVHQSGVKERGPDFQPASHARPVDFGQDVLGKVGFLIERQRPAERINAGARAGGQRLGQGQVLGLDVEQPAVAAAEQQAETTRARRTSPASADEPEPGARQRLGGIA